MTNCLLRRVVPVRSVGMFRQDMNRCTSIIAINQERSEGFSVRTAIAALEDSEIIQNCANQLLDTYFQREH